MAKPQSGPESIVTMIDSLCDWLTKGPRSATSTAERLGTIDSEGGSAIYVNPASAAFSQVIVSREADSSATSYVELVLAQPGSVTVAELQDKFGEYSTPPRVHFNAPVALHFSVDLGSDRPFTCLVVGKVDKGKAEVSDGTVKELGVRVDPR